MSISFADVRASARDRFALFASAAGLSVVLAVSVAAPAHAAEAVVERNEAVVAADSIVRSVVPDARNTTEHQGLSATITKAPTDRAVVSTDGRTFSLVDENGSVLLSSADPTIGVGARLVEAKFIVEGDTLIVTPLTPTLAPRAACASSFWGNLIFNVGMTGVCSALTIGTVVGGVVCTAALIGANTAINWDSQC